MIQLNQIDRASLIVGTNCATKFGQGDKYFIEKAILHPKFNAAKFSYDIALLRTTEPIQLRKTSSAYQV